MTTLKEILARHNITNDLLLEELQSVMLPNHEIIMAWMNAFYERNKRIPTGWECIYWLRDNLRGKDENT